jgi:filamentous hemagglutinin family protein
MHDLRSKHAHLLLSASLLTLVTALAAPGARAQSVGALMAASRQAAAASAAAAGGRAASPANPGSAAAMAAAAANALRYQTQVNSAQNLAQQAQAAAASAAAALNVNQINGIVDGIGAGGLQPAVTAVTNASADPTGLKTWQGANLPTTSPSNPNQVTVVQTQQNAVLSWTSFNVGQHTSLTFQQQLNGVNQPSWVVLNRVVNSVAPSQIFGSIQAPGTVLVLNQNGILFGAGSQVNVGSLVATSLEIGQAYALNGGDQVQTIAQRNASFLEYGLLGAAETYAQSNPGGDPTGGPATFSETIVSGTNVGNYVYSQGCATAANCLVDAPMAITNQASVQVAAGASLTSASHGYLALLAPAVVIQGQLSASDGEVALQSGGFVYFTPSTGTATSVDPNVRGLVVQSTIANINPAPDFVTVLSNDAGTGLIQSPRGYVSIGTTREGHVDDAGVISSTTSIDENGYINIFSPSIQIAADAVIAITPDSSPATLPQDSTSLALFQPSRIRIGNYTAGSGDGTSGPSTQNAAIDFAGLIYAPGATISIGADPGAASISGVAAETVTVESGAAVDVAGLTNVLVPASRNSIEIDPVLGNELADSPAFRNGFLNGATVYLDPRLSGVTANGVEWVGSPLISAAAYAQDVGVPVSELMVAGGNVTLGGTTVNVKTGSAIDVSGGWKTYQAGVVKQSYLVDSNGEVIPISEANPNATYVAVYNGFTVSQPRWGISTTYGNPLLTGAQLEPQYTEGQDAGSLTVAATNVALNGQFNGNAFAGSAQILAATPGTAAATLYNDQRALQAAPSQLPAGGFLDLIGAQTDVDIEGSAGVTSGLSTTAISLNADSLSAAGLSQLTVNTAGAFAVSSDAALTLAPGGVFSASSSRAATINGSITAPSGTIDITTTGGIVGPALVSEPVAPGFADITINGVLDVSGRWANDYGAANGQLAGSAYLNGGTITLTPAAQQTLYTLTDDAAHPVNQDVSGSILVNAGATLKLAGGGYVSPTGVLTLTATGGNLNLIDNTNYYNIGAGENTNSPVFDLTTSTYVTLASLPAYITSRVSIADDTIQDAGFGGGGSFALTTPSVRLAPAGASAVVSAGCGADGTPCGAVLPVDFFSKSGFANYNLTSNGTAFIKNVFDSGKGYYSGILATQTVEVQNDETLDLNETYFSPVLTPSQTASLQALTTGSSLYTVLTPTAPADAWDQKPVNLSLVGLLELKVDVGGQVTGAPSVQLTVSELYNQGTINLPGGTIVQAETNYPSSNAVGVARLTDVFGPQLADGTYSQTAANVFFGANTTYQGYSNQDIASQKDNNGNIIQTPIYLLGDLDVGDAVLLAAGSVTNLGGVAVVNPRAVPTATFTGSTFVDGAVIGGGSFIAEGVTGNGAYKGFVAQSGAALDLAGSSATFERQTLVAGPVAGQTTVGYAPTLVWSNGGNLTLDEGGSIAGATIQSQGGAPLALGGVLNVSNAVLYQTIAPPAAALGVSSTALSAAQVTASRFATFVAQNSLTSFGDVTLTLPRSVFVESAAGLTSSPTGTTYVTIGSGGNLQIDAPYISIGSVGQAVSTPVAGATATGSLTLQASAIDITGAVLFDQSIRQATLSATGDIRLIGQPDTATGQNVPGLTGQLAANGDVTLNSAQLYPTTGSTFTLSTTGVSSPMASKGGAITFNGAGAAPATPYSAGGSLTVLAANIVQNGVVRAPLGSLTLGSNVATNFAPATAALTLTAGSTTSVSADGLDIPYGTTTDQVEWYFNPTQSAALTAPPAGVLHLAGSSIATAAGAAVDLEGGGDVYAYEFVPGTGGTHDVLSEYNTDQYTANNYSATLGYGYQYPNHEQVYAIVPSLSSAAVATLDPIYSANYAALYGAGEAGLTVTLNAAPGLAAGNYTLLPAQYALLPGGMRVVVYPEGGTPAVTAAGAAPSVVLSDGSILTAGYFGVAGVNTRSATPVVFEVQSQAIVHSESDIAQTYGNEYFTKLAKSNGAAVPQLPIDAGQLSVSALTALSLGAMFETTPGNLAASGSEPALTGRGSEVDISGTSLVIDDLAHPVMAPTGAIVLTDTNLTDLDAASLFLGGERTDNANGTTTLAVTANSIALEDGVTLSAPEILMAVDGAKSVITVSPGAAIKATGAVTGESTGNYVIVDGVGAKGRNLPQGGFVRVSDGPQRLLTFPAAANAGSIVIGGLHGAAATLDGASIELNSRGALSLASNTRLSATSLELGASSISVGATGGGLLITPTLQTMLKDTASVTLESLHPIAFASGTYDFQTLTINAPGLTATKSGAVIIDASADLSLTSTTAATRACSGAGAFACGTGTLAITASQIDFGSGTLRTYGSGGGVTLNASGGVFATAAATLNVGSAPLTINSPFVGDEGTGLPGATQPSLTLTTTGAATFASPTPASAFTAPAGTPGSDVTINAQSVSVTGTELRATAGTLTVISATGISISGGAVLTAPSFIETYGDSADPTTVSAPGGLLSLTAKAGDIAVSDDSLLAVGGAQGAAGTLSLTAVNGSIYADHGSTSDVVAIAPVLSAQGGGGSLTLNTGGSFDLSAFASGSGQQFSGAIAITTATGDLNLAAGDTLAATSISLTANAGQITQAGTIDTAGVDGGAVSLYGENGIHLTSTAVIDAQAQGYGLTSTLQATGGNVILGVDGTGAVAVDAGAVIDVSALETGPRLVPMSRTDGTYYTYVPGDSGGTVTFRAPVLGVGTSMETMNVAVQGAVTGASSVVLDGFYRVRLGDDAGEPGVSVSYATNTATLTAGTASQVDNVLSGTNGAVVQFVQSFNVSSIYGQLGGLASLSTFSAHPEVELDFQGNIALASNWNLGAGVVNIKAAVAAGLMAADPGLPGQYDVVGATAQALATNEGLILADYTTALYRVGGSFLGQPGILTIRAGGNLTLDGSITDGFFQFSDQTDPNYLAQVLGGGNRVYQANLAPTYDGSTVTVAFPGASGLLDPGGLDAAAQYVLPAAPYSAAANSAAALGDQPVAGGALVSGTGDPLGSAQLFPLIPTAAGGLTSVASWSYQLVAGAALGPAGLNSTFRPSANPRQVTPGAAGNVVVQGQNVYGYKPVVGATSFADSLDLISPTINPDGLTSVASYSISSPTGADPWLTAFETYYADIGETISGDAATTITLAGLPVRTSVDALEARFAANHPTDQITVAKNGDITTTLAVANAFLGYVSTNFSQVTPDYTPPSEGPISSPTTYATAPTLVRTGTGSIQIFASGTINLENGDQTRSKTTGLPSEKPQILSATGRLVDVGANGVHLGGAAVYTAGAIANLGVVSATDVATGAVYTVDLAATETTSDNLAGQTTGFGSNIDGNPLVVAGAYTYGGGTKSPGVGLNGSFAGVLIANPAYTEGGGSVTLNAGVDVLSRRDTALESALGGFGVLGDKATSLQSWIGAGDEPWRTGVFSMAGGLVSGVNLLTNPQLFEEGVGTLGGGDVTIVAGRNVSDLSTVASNAITTASVGGAVADLQPLALANLSYGGVSITAGGNILGGGLDVAAGDATVKAGGALASAGLIAVKGGQNTPATISDLLRVRLSDGVVTLQSAGSATVESIGAFGLDDMTSDITISAGFYAAGSGVSIVAGGPVTVTDANTEAGLTPSAPTGAVYPGSFEAVSLTAGLNVDYHQGATLLYPDATGTLTLLAAGSIGSAATTTVIAQLDADPTNLPGIFASATPQGFAFPTVLPDTPDTALRLLHNPDTTHAGDAAPDRIAAGLDIEKLDLSTAKQTRVAAGRDIVNMVFLGQNVASSDITRITAGRDITATTALVSVNQGGATLPTLQGDTFVLGGPGAFFLEAGRNAGPFLNSAVADLTDANGTSAPQTIGGGVIAVGNEWNPYLPAQSANIYVAFGVADGQNYAGLVSTYLNPANFSALPGYLFLQSTDSTGLQTPILTEEVYSLSLVQWMTSIASKVVGLYDTAQGVKTPSASAPALIQFLQRLASGGTATTSEALTYLPQLADQTLPLIPWLQLNEPSVLAKAYGTLDVTYAQAFSAFQALPTLTQREFLIPNVYFNELNQTSIPGSPSYLQYSRGYIAVNTLFPAADGYTANALNGGPAGASTTVQTGNLDLRLATIQTDQGGDISLLGPGGEVLAGSVVSTSVQASRRNYDGFALYAGQPLNAPYGAVAISSIPSGYEGILTLQGGSIESFTDQDFLLNQSRAFTEEGGNITIWSSNADVNAGQGPRTTADVAPAVVNINENGYIQVNTDASVTGAGIGAFNSDSEGLAPDVFLIAPRGTVDAGAAGIRSSGNIFIAAFAVANTAGIQATGTISGSGAPGAVNVSAQTSGNAAAAAVAQAAQAASDSAGQFERPIIVVDVLGYLGNETDLCAPQLLLEGRCK